MWPESFTSGVTWDAIRRCFGPPPAGISLRSHRCRQVFAWCSDGLPLRPSAQVAQIESFQRSQGAWLVACSSSIVILGMVRRCGARRIVDAQGNVFASMASVQKLRVCSRYVAPWHRRVQKNKYLELHSASACALHIQHGTSEPQPCLSALALLQALARRQLLPFCSACRANWPIGGVRACLCRPHPRISSDGLAVSLRLTRTQGVRQRKRPQSACAPLAPPEQFPRQGEPSVHPPPCEGSDRSPARRLSGNLCTTGRSRPRSSRLRAAGCLCLSSEHVGACGSRTSLAVDSEPRDAQRGRRATRSRHRDSQALRERLQHVRRFSLSCRHGAVLAPRDRAALVSNSLGGDAVDFRVRPVFSHRGLSPAFGGGGASVAAYSQDLPSKLCAWDDHCLECALAYTLLDESGCECEPQPLDYPHGNVAISSIAPCLRMASDGISGMR